MPCFTAAAESGIPVNGADLLMFTAHIFFLPFMALHPTWLMVDCIMQYELHNYKTP